MGDGYARTMNNATADYRLTDLKKLAQSLDVQVRQLNGDSVSNQLLVDLTACLGALKTALATVSVDKAKQDIAQAQRVIQVATKFINDLEAKYDEADSL